MVIAIGKEIMSKKAKTKLLLTVIALLSSSATILASVADKPMLTVVFGILVGVSTYRRLTI